MCRTGDDTPRIPIDGRHKAGHDGSRTAKDGPARPDRNVACALEEATSTAYRDQCNAGIDHIVCIDKESPWPFAIL
jgi:hypothetical protein